MLIRSTVVAAALVLTSGLAISTDASARPGARNHAAAARAYPGRAQVNTRIARQQVRITREVRQGDMSRAEAHGLRQDVHQVRVDERAYAQANGNNGHLTRAQVKDLNHDLNQTSKAIGR